MNFTTRRTALVICGALTLALLSTQIAFTQQRSIINSAQPLPALPNPVLYPIVQEPYTTGGKNWIRYKFAVLNYDVYPNEMFAAAPELPPCGANRQASRTWVDFYDMSGKRLYGFCGFKKNTNLNDIWFAMEEGVIPPSYVYIELNDRKTNTKYKSNLAETTQ
jgi:hypothetical protein